jgi:hypothetical protein
MTRRIPGIVLACAIGGISTAPQAADFAFGAKLSTLGAGLELSTPLSERLNARAGVNYFQYDTSVTESGIDYDADLKLRSISAMLDWHPMRGGFRLTAGILGNGNKLSLIASGEDDYTIGDATYRGDLRLDGNVDFRSAAPYLGLGWGNVFGKGGAWSFTADAGVVLQGKPRPTLAASGTAQRLENGVPVGPVIDVADDPLFQQELAREEQNLRDELDRFQYYPVLSIGLAYRF